MGGGGPGRGGAHTALVKSFRRAWPLVALLALGAGFGGSLAIRAFQQEAPGRPEVQVAEPGNAFAGELDRAGVQAAQSYEFLPVLWLGEEFEGFKVTEVRERIFETPWAGEGTKARQLVVLYGDCKRDGDPDRSSCTKPVQVIISGPGLVPSPEAISPRAGWSGVYDRQGTRAIETDTGTVLWTTGGAAVTLITNSDGTRERALSQLKVANGKVFGVSETEAGKLGPVTSVALPEQFPTR